MDVLVHLHERDLPALSTGCTLACQSADEKRPARVCSLERITVQLSLMHAELAATVVDPVCQLDGVYPKADAGFVLRRNGSTRRVDVFRLLDRETEV